MPKVRTRTTPTTNGVTGQAPTRPVTIPVVEAPQPTSTIAAPITTPVLPPASQAAWRDIEEEWRRFKSAPPPSLIHAPFLLTREDTLLLHLTPDADQVADDAPDELPGLRHALRVAFDALRSAAEKQPFAVHASRRYSTAAKGLLKKGRKIFVEVRLRAGERLPRTPENEPRRLALGVNATVVLTSHVSVLGGLRSQLRVCTDPALVPVLQQAGMNPAKCVKLIDPVVQEMEAALAAGTTGEPKKNLVAQELALALAKVEVVLSRGRVWLADWVSQDAAEAFAREVPRRTKIRPPVEEPPTDTNPTTPTTPVTPPPVVAPPVVTPQPGPAPTSAPSTPVTPPTPTT